MISHRYKCIFVHIPKTGGSTIENMIWSARDKTPENLWMGFISEYHNEYQTGGLQHLLASQIENKIGKLVFNEYFKFTMVRDPFEKLLSQYRYMSKRKDLRNFIGMTENTCLNGYLDLITRKLHVQWEQQYRFILDDNGEKLVDSILRFENFESEVESTLEHLGVNYAHIRHDNKSPVNYNGCSYERDSYERVAELYRNDFLIFDYSCPRFECSKYAL